MPYTAITHDSRHPFEILIMVAGIIAGGAAMFGGLWPSSIEAAFPLSAQMVWGSVLEGGAVIALIGIWTPRRATGVLLEQVGLLLFATACSTYSAALLVYNFAGAFSIATFLLLIAVACVIQWYRIEKAIRDAIAKGHRIKARRDRGDAK